MDSDTFNTAISFQTLCKGVRGKLILVRGTREQLEENGRKDLPGQSDPQTHGAMGVGVNLFLSLRLNVKRGKKQAW